MACPCMPCRNLRWVTAWAEGRVAARPDDETIKEVVRRITRLSDLARLKAEGR